MYRPNNRPSSNLPGRPILNRVIPSGNDDWQDGWDDGCLLHRAVLCSMMRRLKAGDDWLGECLLPSTVEER